MGANASCVQLKIDGILELRLVFFRHVFTWLYDKYVYKKNVYVIDSSQKLLI